MRGRADENVSGTDQIRKRGGGVAMRKPCNRIRLFFDVAIERTRIAFAPCSPLCGFMCGCHLSADTA